MLSERDFHLFLGFIAVVGYVALRTIEIVARWVFAHLAWQ